MLSDLTSFIIRYCAHLMTDPERRAHLHLVTTMKATGGRSDIPAQEKVRADKVRSRWLSTDPEVLRLVSDGYEAFGERTARRILAENKEEVFLNCCPKCGALARTPRASQCRACRYDWHDPSKCGLTS